MRNIEDWCISRQIWWGHRIPAWYDRRGNVYVGRSEAEIRKNNDLPPNVPLVQDPDVLDTWFSSALWPFSTLGWPEKTKELETFYPTSVLVTGFDIIFFWVARMIMMGLKFTGKAPFKEVYIHGLVRDAEGQKMSKSKGNVLDPIDLIDGIELNTLVKKRTGGLMQPEMAQRIKATTEKQFPDGIPSFGTDALRFTFAALASTGRDIRFDMSRIEGYRNFCNKLWNAARYVLMNTQDQDVGHDNPDIQLSLADRWIRSRLQVTTREVCHAIDIYRFDLAAQAIYEFTWNEYCDWYLELSKPVLMNTESPAPLLRGTRHTLINVLESILRLAHPIIPFVTEEIWQRVSPLAGKSGETIMLQPYPATDERQIDPPAVQEMRWVMEFILGIRKIRGEMNIPPNKALPVLLQNGSAEDRECCDNNTIYLTNLAKLETINWLEPQQEAPEAATALVGEMKILIPLAGLIDKDAELGRLEKEIAKLRKDLARSEAKLSNPNFVDRAPTEVVAKERQRVTEMRSAVKKLDEQLNRIESL
jgi:valyl-tRNA synthetase